MAGEVKQVFTADDAAILRSVKKQEEAMDRLTKKVADLQKAGRDAGQAQKKAAEAPSQKHRLPLTQVMTGPWFRTK